MTGARARSTFVTAVGWIFLVLSGFTASVLILQSGKVRSTALRFGRDFVDAELVFLALLLVPLFTFCSSLGVLRRREWARKALIAILAFGVLWNIGSAAVDTILFGANSPYNSASRPGEFRSMTAAVLVLTWCFAVAASALFFWIIRRLASPSVRAEFQATV
jgi:hypothetical protein